MNKAMLTVGIILLSLVALLMINVISNYSTGSELDYYLLKETTEASMSDAVDVDTRHIGFSIETITVKTGTGSARTGPTRTTGCAGPPRRTSWKSP